jgi:2-phosphosulfolactate phosphatase
MPRDALLCRYVAGELGARAGGRAGAAIVVVDAYRASTTIAVLVSKGARVVPVASIEQAAVAEADFRIGERGSAKVAGFDFGNSPTEISSAEIPPGSTVALSTTNGTRVVEAASGAPSILSGAFVNATAVAEALLSGDYGAEVYVIGCGWEGRRASEDEAASAAVMECLADGGAEIDDRARSVVEVARRRDTGFLRRNSAARRLRRLGYDADLAFCLARDTVPVVPRLLDGAFVGASVGG